ncbi:MAG: crossover junction endodeoxyribonuclease RuvC [Helicobacteraceae bacterium]|jgi:crossover junction endodeoxyribonuclease RuvC|nr:crossover junction endodeoxyribonuclease RuvC [Helicobacteraceae bacterium]
MVILGIDPGTAKCGYSLLKVEQRKMSLIEAGFIKIAPNPLVAQLPELIAGLDLILKNHKIDEAAIEDIFFAYNPKTVLKLAQFRGAILLKIIQDLGVFHEYTPLQVKKSVTGKGKAGKEQVAYMVKVLLGIKQEIKPLDITDAIAVAIAHAQRTMIRK